MTARKPIAVDLFAGGGGFSTGAVEAGVKVIVAVNHNEAAIEMHRENHPTTLHLCESVWAVDPRGAIGTQPIDLLLASPDCRHFSRAKGSATVDRGIRGLAWIVLRWAARARPTVIIVENVAEFTTWGPVRRGKPVRSKAGRTFERFLEQLRALGYAVDWRVLNAADYGTPTTRRRLFLIARRDGQPIRWPTPTHGPGRALPWRTAAECIDWSIPCPSIFLSPEEGRELGVRRPLAEATQRRIAEGVRRFVLEHPRPFLVTLTHGGRVEAVDEPMRTVTAAHRGERALVAPFVAPVKSWGGGGNGPAPADAPLRTITASKRGEHALVAPLLVETGNGERAGQRPRTSSVERPLGTVTARGSQGALVAAFLARHFGGPRQVIGRELDQPVPTVTATDHHSLVAGVLLRSDMHQSNSRCVYDVREPMRTATSATGGGFGVVAAFLTKYYGTGGQWCRVDEPLHTATGHARFGLVVVEIEGVEHVLVDIGMRMLQPRELATANGCPPTMVLTGSKSEQTARIGNMVCPPVARALVAVNVPRLPEQVGAAA